MVEQMGQAELRAVGVPAAPPVCSGGLPMPGPRSNEQRQQRSRCDLQCWYCRYCSDVFHRLARPAAGEEPRAMLPALRPDPPCKAALEQAAKTRHRVRALAMPAPDAPPAAGCIFEVIVDHRRMNIIHST